MYLIRGLSTMVGHMASLFNYLNEPTLLFNDDCINKSQFFKNIFGKNK